MAISIQSQVIEAVKVYRITVRLTTITPIPDPVAYVSQPTVWMEVLAIAGLPELLFVAAVLIDEGFIGEERYYDLDMTFDHTHVTATGHSHDSSTLFHPLREAYRDGPYIDLASNLGPVDIWSTVDTIDYFKVRKTGGDTYFFVEKDGTIQLGSHVRFLRDCEFDIGSKDGGSVLRRPRDVYICRDLDVGNDVAVGGDLDVVGHGLFGDFVQGSYYLYNPQPANPDPSPTSRLTYWNSTDNTLRGWDGTTEFILAGGTPVGISGIYSCSPIVAIGDAVSIVGSGAVDRADATILGQRPVIGVVVSKPNSTTAVVQLYGEVGVFAGSLIPDQLYFLAHVPGTITNNTAGFVAGDTVQLIGISKTDSILTLRFESRIWLA